MTPASTKQRDRFINLLRDLFQLNQPDLDFGLYRIMHAKSAEIEKFLSEDLLAIIASTFAGNANDHIDIAKTNLEKELATAIEYGVADPENLRKVMQARAAYEVARNSTGDDAEIYDHLYRFFERYYDQGDFLSRRYYARETHERAAPYSVPYDGSEVYLHWANKDQYYIKSSTSFSNFSVDLDQARDSEKQSALFDNDDAKLNAPRKLHLRLIDAVESEHNNVKASGDKDRFFLIDATPYEWKMDTTGNIPELICRFQYRADSEKTGNTSTWRDKRNLQAVETIINALQQEADGSGIYAQHAKHFLQALQHPVSKGARKAGGKQEMQALLARYITQYTGINTMDYFIHKNLGDFLKRELDFFIKNEVMRLDDLGTANEPQVADYHKFLKKLHTLRSIAQQLITFLAQIEDFQKKLWLKKKFVIDTEWLITLDRVPAELYPQIISNDKQWDQWKELGFLNLDEQAKDLISPAASRTLAYLQSNTALVLDTQNFDPKNYPEFTEQLLASIDNLDEATDGVLVHSENFQALHLMQERYRGQVKCIYIDPPYNTGSDGFPYKDNYQHSSWLSMIVNRLHLSKKLIQRQGASLSSIGNDEEGNFRQLLDNVFGKKSVPFLWKSRAKPTNAGSAKYKPQVVGEFVYMNLLDETAEFQPLRSGAVRRYPHVDNGGKYRTTSILTSNLGRYKRETMRFKINEYTPPEDKRWKAGESEIQALFDKNEIDFNDSGEPYRKHYENSEDEQHVPLWTFMPEEITGTAESGKTELSSLLGAEHGFDSVKPKELIQVFLNALTKNQDLVVDYFAGTGTTAHAVIDLNREDDFRRKYLLAEAGDHFYGALKPRICKVIYSSLWKSAKPQTSDGIPQLVKVIRLESYEDTLNNLKLTEDSPRKAISNANPQIRADYYLQYLLNLETQTSPSLLNITAFSDPTAYQLEVKCPGSDAHELRTVDLLESFNWLIGLRVDKLHASQSFTANFIRETDPDLPLDSATRLLLSDKLQSCTSGSDAPHWWFRSVEGRVPAAVGSLIEQNVLIVWRKLSGDLEQDNAVLEAYLREILRIDLSNIDDKNLYDVIYVNGSHSLPKLAHCDIRLLEETFHQRMWESQDV